jgi:capsular polysaccharide biosynthesis protein
VLTARLCADLLAFADRDRPRVVVVGPQRRARELESVLSSDATVTRLPGLEPDGLLAELVAGAPVDLVLDASPRGRAQHRLRVAVHAVRPGGAVVVETGADSGVHRLARRLQRRRTSGPQPDRGPKGRDQAALAASLADLRIEEDGDRVVVVATTRRQGLAKLGEAAHERVLAARPSAGRTLLTLPSVAWTAENDVRASSSTNELPRTYSSAPLALREYADATSAGRGVAWADGSVVPASFRLPQRPRLKAPPLEELSPWHVATPEPAQTFLPGTHFLVDTHVPDHFGHALTEQLGHLWGWDEAAARHPGLRALVHGTEGRVPRFTSELLEAAGVPRDAVTVVEAPVRVERLLTTTAAYVIGHRLHPVIRETYDRVGERLDARSSLTDTPTRLFHTRRHGKRTCRNAAEVEAAAEAAGFTVIRPEEHSLADQVRMVRRAEVVAGFAGSGLFHVALSARPQHLVVIGSESYPAHNEQAFAALRGHRLDLVVCRPDIPRGRVFTQAAFHSDFVVDWEREGRLLLAALG